MAILEDIRSAIALLGAHGLTIEGLSCSPAVQENIEDTYLTDVEPIEVAVHDGPAVDMLRSWSEVPYTVCGIPLQVVNL